MKLKLLSCFLLLAGVLQAQITFEGCTTGAFGAILGDFPNGNPQTYTLTHTPAQDVGMRHTYVGPLTSSCFALGGGFCPIRIIWTGSRWELQLDGGGDGSFQAANIVPIYYNTSASIPNPPSLNLGTWIEDESFAGGPGLCNGMPPSTLSGDVQDDFTLTLSSFEKSNIKIINPVGNHLELVLAENDKLNYLKIYSLQGKELIESATTKTNISTLKKGFYFVQIFTETHKYTHKIIKN